MDLSEDENDTDSDINFLLNSLKGIEQCFIVDPEVVQSKLQLLPRPALTARKRSIEPELPAAPTSILSELPAVSASIDSDQKDPRLQKIRSLPIIPKAVSLPVPTFMNSGDRLGASNPKKLRLKPIKISTQLAKYLEKHTSSDSKIYEKTSDVIESSVVAHSIASQKTPTPEERARRERTLGFISKCRREESSTESPSAENIPGVQSPPLDCRMNGETLPVDMKSVPHDPRIGKYVMRRRSKELSTSPLESEPVCSTREETVNVLEVQEESSQLSDNVAGMENAESGAGESENIPVVAQAKPRTLPKKLDERQLNHGNSSDELPPEILIEIFKYLPLRDRKRAKLVCRRWCSTLNMKLFLIRQRFVCCGIYNTDSILRTLADSECTYFNLEFHRVHFTDAYSKHWKQLGPKIHALYLSDCVLTAETLEDVIMNCTEMEHLSLAFERLKVPSVKLFSLALFENLFKRGIHRPKLVSLDLQLIANGWFSNAIVSNLFGIYPNISRLGFTCHSLNPVARGMEAVPPDEINFTDLWSSKSLTFSPVLKKILSPPDSMEKLRLDAHTKGLRTGFAWQLVIAHSKFTRLREIVIEIDLKKLSANAVIEFCTAQRELKSFTCKIVGSAKLFVSLFLLKLLDNCFRLRYLSVSYKDGFHLSYELFRKLVPSELKLLCIDSSRVSLAPQLVRETEWLKNEHLQSLTLSNGVGATLKTLLLVSFLNLKFLEINDLSDQLLQLICKFQTSLVSLKLAGIEECTIDGFCGAPENKDSCSIRNLQNLEYLVLETVNKEWHVYGDVFSEFQFPKLRYFCVDIEASSTLLNDLIEAMQNFNALEAVSITCSGVARSSWLSINRKWRKLRYLRIVDKESDKFKEKHYRRFFKVSPKLRAVFHESKGSTDSYYYDVLEKRVRKKHYQAKFRISSEKVGNSFIDWLWF